MPISVGEVEAVLTARDNMSPAMQLAALRVQDLEYKLGTLGATSVASFSRMNQQLEMAQQKFDIMSQSSTKAALGLDEVEKSAAKGGQSLSGMEGIAMRMIERMVIMYAMRASFQFVVGIFEAADAMVKLSGSTDMSINKLQEISYSADILGIPFTKITTAINSMDKKLSEVKMSTSDALAKIGLSFTQLFNMSPDERFDTIVAAIAKMPTQLDRTAAEVEIFGTDTIDPLIKQFASLAKQAHETNSVMGDDTVHTLANTVTIYRSAWSEVKPILIDAIEWGQKAFETLGKVWYMPHGTGPGGNVGPIGGPGSGADIPKSGWSVDPGSLGSEDGPAMGAKYIQYLKDEASGIKEISVDQVLQLGQLKEMNLLTADRAARLGLNSEQFKLYVERANEMAKSDREAAIELKKFQKALEDAESAGSDYKATIDGMDVNTKEYARSLVALGVPMSDILILSKATVVEVKALETERRNAAAAIKQEEQFTREAGVAWAKYFEIKADMGATDEQKAINKHTREFLSAISHINMEKTGWQGLYASKAALRDIEDKATEQSKLEKDKGSKESYELAYAKEKELYEFRMAHAGSYTAEQRQESKDRMEHAKKELEQWRQSGDAARQAAAELGGMSGSVQMLTASMNSSSMQVAAYEGNLQSLVKTVHTLGGEWLTAAEAKKQFDMGSTKQVTSANLSEMLDQYVTSTVFGSGYQGSMDYHGLQGTGSEAAKLAHKGYSFEEIVDFFLGKHPLAQTPIGPRIPGFAEGGIVMVGEKGPEAVRLPFGSAVYPNQYAQGMADPTNGITTMIQAINDVIAKTIPTVLNAAFITMMRVELAALQEQETINKKYQDIATKEQLATEARRAAELSIAKTLNDRYASEDAARAKVDMASRAALALQIQAASDFQSKLISTMGSVGGGQGATGMAGLIATMQSILSDPKMPGGQGSTEALRAAINALMSGGGIAAARAGLGAFTMDAERSSDFMAKTPANQAIGAYGSGSQLFRWLLSRLDAEMAGGSGFTMSGVGGGGIKSGMGIDTNSIVDIVRSVGAIARPPVIINASFNIVDTESEIVRRVADTLVTRIKQNLPLGS